MSSVGIATGLGLLLSVVSLIGLVVLFWFALRKPPVQRPSCGHCGYAVEGLEALSCPECGSDLRQVGIETPKRRMLHPGLFVLLWSLLLVIPLLTAYTIAMRMGPQLIVADATFEVASEAGSMPPLHVAQRMEAIVIGQNVFVTTASESTVERDGTRTTTIDLPAIAGASMRSRTVGVRTVADAARAAPATLTLDSARAGAVDVDAVAAAFGEPGLGTPEEAAEVAALLDALIQGEPTFAASRLRITGNNTITSGSATPGWYVPTLIAIGAAIYALGIVVYLMLRRRRLAARRA